MSKKQYIIFGLDGVLIETNNILVKNVKAYIKSKFPNKTIDLSSCENLNILQLLDKTKLFKSKPNTNQDYKDLEMETSKLQAHIRNINLQISEEIRASSFEMIEKVHIENLVEYGYKLSLISNLDAMPTFELLKKIGISQYFTVIFSRDDTLNLPPSDEVFQNIFKYFNEDSSLFKVYMKNFIYIVAAKNKSAKVYPMKNLFNKDMLELN